MSITSIIKPIVLKSGSHSDTAQTGSGCFMNVIAYLNGEPQITDASSCVCVTVRKIAIWFNDYLDDNERGELIQFIERAMGSYTEDRAEMNRRLALMVTFAERQRDIAKDATYAAKTSRAADANVAAANAADTATYAATYAVANAATIPATYAVANAVANAASAAANAAYAAANAVANAAAANATYAAYAGKYRAQIKAATFEYLDAVLPKACTPSAHVLERAKALIAIAA